MLWELFSQPVLLHIDLFALIDYDISAWTIFRPGNRIIIN